MKYTFTSCARMHRISYCEFAHRQTHSYADL